jgi:hypothetical protein
MQLMGVMLQQSQAIAIGSMESEKGEVWCSLNLLQWQISR